MKGIQNKEPEGLWGNPGAPITLPQDLGPIAATPMGTQGTGEDPKGLVAAHAVAGMGPCSPAPDCAPHVWKRYADPPNFSPGPRHLCYGTGKSCNF